MPLGLIILIAVVIAVILELILLLLWMATEAVLVRRFKAPKTVDTDTFKQVSCNGVPYALDRGLPYKGDISIDKSVKDVLNKGFKFSLDSRFCSPNGILDGYQKVDLPHCYNLYHTALKDYRGDVWYEREINIKSFDDKRVIRLTFMGSFLTTDVWIDGVHLGRNREGYLPFTFDISSLSKGKHRLVVKVNNEASTATLPILLFKGHKPGWHHYSGLHKDVYIEYLEEVSVFKLACIPVDKGGKWAVNASLLLERSNLLTNQTVECKLNIVNSKNKTVGSKDLKVHFIKGERVGGLSTSIEVDNPALWSENTPVLYKAVLSNAYGNSSVAFGFRKVSWGDGKIRINNKPVFLRGICRHEDNGDAGHATDAKIIKSELDIISKMNGNFVRLAHYPHSKTTMNMTDEMGMYVWSEIPFYQAGHAITHDTFGKEFGYVKMKGFSLFKLLGNLRKTNLARDKKLLVVAAQSLIKLVERDINHPSIITWGVGNEVWSVNEAAGRALGWLRDVVRQYDTSRAVNYASMSMPVLTVPFESSFKYMDWACVNEYFGWYYGKIEDAKTLAERLYKKYPDKPLVITETGSDTLYGRRDETYPPKDKHSEDYQKYFLEETWKSLHASPAFSGLSLWVFKDFPCPEYGETNPVPFYNMKGLFDKDMNEKLGYKTIQDLYGIKKNK